jgi:hypothetical protein
MSDDRSSAAGRGDRVPRRTSTQYADWHPALRLRTCVLYRRVYVHASGHAYGSWFAVKCRFNRSRCGPNLSLRPIESTVAPLPALQCSFSEKNDFVIKIPVVGENARPSDRALTYGYQRRPCSANEYTDWATIRRSSTRTSMRPSASRRRRVISSSAGPIAKSDAGQDNIHG